MRSLATSRKENPMKRPRDPPTEATMAAKSKSKTSSMMTNSFSCGFSHNDVRRWLLSSSATMRAGIQTVDFNYCKLGYPNEPVNL